MKSSNKVLGDLAARFFAYTQLRKKDTIVTGQLSQILRIDAAQERDLLRRMARAGWITRLRRGLYAVPSQIPAGGKWNPGIHVALRQLMMDRQGTYQICGPNAFYLYGFDNQIPQSTTVYNNRISGERHVGNICILFIKVSDSRLGGTATVEPLDGVRGIYSSKSRTLIDAVYDWSRFNGIPRAYEWIRATVKSEPRSVRELVRMAVQFGNQSAIRRIGYLLEQMEIPTRTLKPLRESLRQSKGLVPWIPIKPARGRINREWGVIVND
jgi:predicted transcriptional regulator of viral defense system